MWCSRFLTIFCIVFVTSAVHVRGLRIKRDNDDECGQVKAIVKKLVLHGSDAEPGQLPWHAAVYHNSDAYTSSYACGGTLIHSNIVVTAAHCVSTNGVLLIPDALTVRLGRYMLGGADPRGADYNVFKMVVHDNYSDTEITNRNDLALVYLREQVVYTNYIQPACLWNHGLDYDINHKRGTIGGWGKRQDGKTSQILQVATMSIPTFFECLHSNQPVYGQVLSDYVYCAGDKNGTNVCGGDSGGGMVFEIDNTFYLRGIVSFTIQSHNSPNCDPLEYSVFIDVFKHLEWIHGIINGKKSKYSPYAKDVKIRVFNDRPAVEMCTEYSSNSIRNSIDSVISDLTITNCDYSNKLIIGQRLVAAGEFPHMAAIGLKDHDIIHFYCGGSIISEYFILTAANCQKDSILEVVVRLGERNLLTNDDGAVDYSIETFINYPFYTRVSQYKNNIALIKLSTKIEFTRLIQPACLWTEENLNFRSAIATGFGRSTFLGEKDVLLKYRMTLYTNEECEPYYNISNSLPEGLTDRHLCAIDPKSEHSTSEIEGSPLQVVVSGNTCLHYIVGITSFEKYSIRIPEGFTRVSSYLEWIETTVWGNTTTNT